MEDRMYKQVIAVILSVIVIAVAVYGSYLPMRKAQVFISTLQSLQTTPATSLQDLETRISTPLNYTSPVGQEELVRNVANSVLSFIQQGADATSTGVLLDFLGSYYDPIIARGKGMSFGQDLYLEGAVHELAFAQTGNPLYLAGAEQYFREGSDQGPNRPQPLYGLFDVYRAAGDVTDTIAIGNRILANWPNDTRVQQSLSQFLNPPSSTKKSK